MVLVHGNGPQVGLLALQNSAYDKVTPYPLDVLGAESQGMIGYERNVWTNEKYDKAGITVLPIPGDELGRGRGGARCMSCPLERDGI